MSGDRRAPTGAAPTLPRLHILQAASELSTDGLIAADGTMWSHACTIGQYTKGDATFSLDRGAIDQFVANFRGSDRCKVPVDYEHASTSNDPEVRKLRAQGEIKKAGDVLELRGVFAATDFTGELLAAATKLTEKAGRPLDDPRNLGLWMRWKPTARALAAIQAGEFSELSITFDEDWQNKATGKSQGWTLLAVALTMLPFLDGMLPVAASLASDSLTQDPNRAGGSETQGREDEMTRTITMLAAVAALSARPVSTEEDAVIELTALQPEVTRLRALGTVIAERFGGETDPVKVAAKLTELATTVTRYETEMKAAKETALTAQVDAALKEHEDRIVPAVRNIFAGTLKSELAAGTTLKECPTYKAMSAMPKHGITGQASVADERGEGGGLPGGSDADAQLERAKDEILASDPEVKALSAKGLGQQATDLAYDKAAAKIKFKSPQQLRAAR